MFFFFISLIFPSGKLGVGPPNPFFLSFRYARVGEIQQENNNFPNRTRKTTPVAKRKDWDIPTDSIALSLSLQKLASTNKFFLCWLEKQMSFLHAHNRLIEWVFIEEDGGVQECRNFWPWGWGITYFEWLLNHFFLVFIWNSWDPMFFGLF